MKSEILRGAATPLKIVSKLCNRSKLIKVSFKECAKSNKSKLLILEAFEDENRRR